MREGRKKKECRAQNQGRAPAVETVPNVRSACRYHTLVYVDHQLYMNYIQLDILLQQGEFCQSSPIVFLDTTKNTLKMAFFQHFSSTIQDINKLQSQIVSIK